MQNPAPSSPISFLERLKTQAQLTLLVKDFNGLQPGVPLYVVKLAGLAAKMMQALRTFIDRHRLAYDTVYAAGGTPHAMFPIAPADLVRVAQGAVADTAPG